MSIKEDDVNEARELKEGVSRLIEEVHKVIVGQDDVIKQLLTAIFCQGHCVMEGVPGLAKTLLVDTLSKCMDMRFKRIQFTPDLMPSDITGTDIIQENSETGRREFEFQKGPLFTNMLLADEINRTPPKTQASLLEAMQERKVTVGEKTYALPKPFFVLATQNPIEQEGTYNLPEAQLDRFMFLVYVDYPNYNELLEVLRRTTSTKITKLEQILSKEDVIKYQKFVKKVPVPEHVLGYSVRIVQATHINKPTGLESAKKNLSWGAGPRAAQNMIMGAKAFCLLDGRFTVSTEDVEAVALPVLRHRIVLNFAAEAEGLSPDDVVKEILKEVPAVIGKPLK